MDELQWSLLEEHTPLERIAVSGGEIKNGDRVILRPGKSGDVFDIALANQIAIIEAIEQTYENQIQIAVVLEDDPGRDLGMMRQPGHRFFFSPEEIEPLAERMRDKI